MKRISSIIFLLLCTHLYSFSPEDIIIEEKFERGFLTQFRSGLTIDARHGARGQTSQSILNAPGIVENGALVSFPEESLSLRLSRTASFPQGTISLWIQPIGWNSADRRRRYFLKAQGTLGLHFLKDEASKLVFSLGERPSAGGPRPTAAARIVSDLELKERSWYHFILTWDRERMRLFADGTLIGQSPFRVESPPPAAKGDTIGEPTTPQSAGGGERSCDEFLLGRNAISPASLEEPLRPPPGSEQSDQTYTLFDELLVLDKALTEKEAMELNLSYYASIPRDIRQMEMKYSGEGFPAARRATWYSNFGDFLGFHSALFAPEKAIKSLPAARRGGAVVFFHPARMSGLIKKYQLKGVKALAYVSFYKAPLLSAPRDDEGWKGNVLYEEVLQNPFWQMLKLDRNPGIYAYDKAGNIMPARGRYDCGSWYQICPSAELTRNAILAALKELLDAGYDGIFVDESSWIAPVCYGDKYKKHRHTPSRAGNEEAYLQLLREVHKLVTSYGSDKIIIINNPNARMAAYCDGITIDSFVCARQAPGRWAFYGFDGVLRLADYWRSFISKGKAVTAVSYFKDSRYPLEDDLFLAYACAKYAGFTFTDAGTVATHYANFLYDVDLGSSESMPYEKNGVYYRAFKNGAVVINPSKEEKSVMLPILKKYRKLFDIYDNKKLRGQIVNVPPDSGRVLLTPAAIKRLPRFYDYLDGHKYLDLADQYRIKERLSTSPSSGAVLRAADFKKVREATLHMRIFGLGKEHYWMSRGMAVSVNGETAGYLPCGEQGRWTRISLRLPTKVRAHLAKENTLVIENGTCHRFNVKDISIELLLEDGRKAHSKMETTGYTSDPTWGYSFAMGMAAPFLGAPLPKIIITFELGR